MKIDKGLELPDKQSGGRETKYPYKELEVGDSYLVKLKKYSKSKHASISSAAAQWVKRNELDWKFTVRKVDEGIRVWRTH